MDFVEANGLKLAYLSEGSGPLVLLFHGFPDTAHTWDFVLLRIAAKGYRAIAPFMRGYAPTDIPKRDTDQGTLARDVLALVEAFGEKEASIPRSSRRSCSRISERAQSHGPCPLAGSF